jgi:hypothetical protein
VIEPAYFWVPPRVGSYGDEAIDIARMAGRELDEEQCLAVDAMLSYGPGGRWVALESGIVEPRQNGKTGGVLLPVTLFDLFLLPPDRIVWTAHIFRTARDAFSDFCTCIETAPELSKRVKRISYSHGEESIELHSGALLEFLARSSGGGRGLGGKRVVMDEALFLQAAAMGALMPTLSARPDPQVNYGSSAALQTSDQLHRLKDRGRKGGDLSLIWIEFCAPGSWKEPPCELGRVCQHTVGSPSCAFDNEALIGQANHTAGDRITWEYLRAERRALPVQEFGRERLGWHEDPPLTGGDIDAAAWHQMTDVESRREGDVTIGVDLNPQQAAASIALFGIRADGREHMQLMDCRPGIDWVPDRLVELREILNPVGYAMGRNTYAALEAELTKQKFLRPEKPEEPARGNVAVVAGADMSAATGQMLTVCRPIAGTDGALDYRARHIGQRELNAAVASAMAREGTDSITWSRKDSGGDITPLNSVTVAKWLYQAWAHLVTNDYDVMESVY